MYTLTMDSGTTLKVRFDTQGRALIPKRVREALGVANGDEVVAKLENGVLVLEPRQVLLERLQEKYAGETSLVDSLRELRNEEAEAE